MISGDRIDLTPPPLDEWRKPWDVWRYWPKVAVVATSGAMTGYSAGASAWGDVVTGLVLTTWIAWVFRPPARRRHR